MTAPVDALFDRNDFPKDSSLVLPPCLEKLNTWCSTAWRGDFLYDYAQALATAPAVLQRGGRELNMRMTLWKWESGTKLGWALFRCREAGVHLDMSGDAGADGVTDFSLRYVFAVGLTWNYGYIRGCDLKDAVYDDEEFYQEYDPDDFVVATITSRGAFVDRGAGRMEKINVVELNPDGERWSDDEDSGEE